jgi:hypothetical protein
MVDRVIGVGGQPAAGSAEALVEVRRHPANSHSGWGTQRVDEPRRLYPQYKTVSDYLAQASEELHAQSQCRGKAFAGGG